MSIIAGIYSRQPNFPVPLSIRESLRRLISRKPGDEVLEFGDQRAFFVKVDVGAFEDSGHCEDRGFAVLAGAPLLKNGGQNRQADLREVSSGFDSGSSAALRMARGVFCVADYRTGTDTLSLATDKLGIRPLYYAVNDRYVIFSSALRVLEQLAEVPKTMNLRAVTEIAALGYALADRTPYRDIYILKGGEVLQANGSVISKRFYWKWNDIKQRSASEGDFLEELYSRFDNAVSTRLRSDSSTIAYLSGGLDSRCIVASLCNQSAHVHTFNFARPDTQDQVLGRYFAERVDVTHREVPKAPGDNVPDYSTLMADARAAQTFAPERPNLVWSGEGGSVGLGHVHLGRRIVELMRDDRTDAAIEEFLEREHVYMSPRLLRPEIFNEVDGIIPQGIREELAEVTMDDPARGFHLFLMLNDQRRKLAGHFEDVDRHRLEFQLPFFDSEFVEFIISIPVDICLEHKLYVKLLKLFPEAVSAVPWQAYPGHEPCPHAIPDNLAYQWQTDYLTAEKRSVKSALIKQAAELLGAKDFPAAILSRKNIHLAALIHRTGWRDYSYIIETAGIFHRYWRKCNGEFSF